jgi:amidohydrolase
MLGEIIKKNMDSVIEFRRHFHQYPELSFEEFETSEYIAEKLTTMGYKVKSKVGGTGVVAILETGIEGPVIAFRADMDALPIFEESGLLYESKRVGVMHACGHDGHMSILLGLALLISEIKDKLKGSIKLIFQPGEEANGGAKCIINDGVLKNPDVDGIFSLHMMPDLPTGCIGVKSGYLSATDDEFCIKVRGIGAHSSEPQTGINAIVIASQIVNALMSVLGSNISPYDIATFSICKISGGDAINVIPDYVEMSGMIRCIEKKNKKIIEEKMISISKSIAKGMGGIAEVEFIEGFPSVNNDSVLTKHVIDAAKSSLLSETDVILIDRPHLGSEDFAYYQEEIPGAMFMLGCKNSISETGSLHSAVLNIDEDSLEYGIRIFSNLVLNICGI